MSTPDYIVIACYLGLMVLLGLVFQHFSSNLSDYIRNGCKGTWWLVGASVFMQGFSALTFTGISGQAYLAGWSVLLIFWSNALVFFIQAAIAAPWLRQTRAITPPDAIRERFNAYSEQIYVYGGMVGTMMWGGMMLLGLATFSSVVFGLPLMGVILFVGVAVIFYSVTGGSWSVASTDYLQALILIPVTIAVSYLALDHIGGLEQLFAQIKSQGLTEDFAMLKSWNHEYSSEFKVPSGLFTPLWLTTVAFTSMISAFSLTTSYRYLAVKTGADASKAAALGGVLMVLGSFIWFIPPVVGRLLFAPEINAITGIDNPADAAYAVVAMKVLPAGLLGLILVAMFSATMSSMDSALTGSAGLIANNIYPALCRKFGWKQLEGRSMLRFVKFINFCLGVWAVLLALILSRSGGGGGLFNIMLNIAILVGGPIGGPFTYALFIRKVPAWGAVFAMGTGFIASVSIFVAKQAYGIELSWPAKILIMQAATAIPFFSTYFLRHTSPAEFYDQVDRFFTKIHTPIDFESEVGEGNDLSQLLILGTLGLLVGILIAFLIPVCDTSIQSGAVAFVSLFISIVALLMLWVGWKSRPAKPSQDS